MKIKESMKFKPNKTSYILFGGFGIFTLKIVAIILLIAYFISGFNSYILFSFLGVCILTIIIYFLVLVCYKKEEYILKDNKIIYNHGNIFSDNSVEINLDKIVQVHTILGFLQYLFFKTGTILINTAGSSTSKLVLRNINAPLEFYEIIQEKMRENGYHLKKDKLVQSAKPHWLGVIMEVFGKIFGAIIIFFVFGGSTIIPALMTGYAPLLVFLGGLVILSVMIMMFIFSYLDLKRRKYDVFTDSVFYTEGFLTRNYSFLPMETIADTENRQGFVSKILGLHDVIVSSEGSNNRVIFRNMIDGEQMMKNIKYLKNSIIRKEEGESKEEKVASELVGFKDKIEKPLDYDKSFTAVYKISMLKAILGILIFVIVPPFFIVLLISQIIRVCFTKYYVTESSIEMRYNFLTNKHNTFSVDKITGVVIKESFIDKWIGTCSIQFWSIGSSHAITFYGIKKIKDLEEKILSKVGIRKNEEYMDIETNFNLANFMKASIGITIFFTLLLLGSIVLLLSATEAVVMIFVGWILLYVVIFFLLYLYKKIFYNKKRYIQRLHKNFVESIRGIFFVSKYYSLFRHIKGAHTTKYPFSTAGSVKLDVAGEQLVQQGNNKPPQMVSNSIRIPYVENIFNIHSDIDTILNEGALNCDLIKTSKQDIANSIIGLIVLGLICTVPLIFIPDGIYIVILVLVFFVLLIGWIIWFIKVKFFNFEKNRVMYHSGIIYKSRHSILYDKINFIEKNEGMLNKIFKNGTVKIYTLGGGGVEMWLSDMDNYREIYDLLKKD